MKGGMNPALSFFTITLPVCTTIAVCEWISRRHFAKLKAEWEQACNRDAALRTSSIHR
jgi:hypothetical protein